jgi:hypothetical protein
MLQKSKQHQGSLAEDRSAALSDRLLNLLKNSYGWTAIPDFFPVQLPAAVADGPVLSLFVMVLANGFSSVPTRTQSTQAGLLRSSQQ